MPRICLLALIGLPGAGKTCLSNWLLQRQETSLAGWNVLHFCYDDHFTAELGDNFDYKTQRNVIYDLLNQLIADLQASDAAQLPAKVLLAPAATASNRYLIVCDDNHYYRSMRYKLYQLCRARGCLYAQLHLATGLAACLLANEARGTPGVPATVIQQMQTRLEPPGADAWERHSLTLSHTDFAAASPTIDEFLKSVLSSRADAAPTAHRKQPQLQSVSHHLDLQLRARIQLQMRANNHNVPRAARSRALNDQRKQILAQFRLDMSSRQTDLADVNLDYYSNLLN